MPLKGSALAQPLGTYKASFPTALPFNSPLTEQLLVLLFTDKPTGMRKTPGPGIGHMVKKWQSQVGPQFP